MAKIDWSRSQKQVLMRKRGSVVFGDDWHYSPPKHRLPVDKIEDSYYAQKIKDGLITRT